MFLATHTVTGKDKLNNIVPLFTSSEVISAHADLISYTASKRLSSALRKVVLVLLSTSTRRVSARRTTWLGH